MAFIKINSPSKRPHPYIHTMPLLGPGGPQQAYWSDLLLMSPLCLPSEAFEIALPPGSGITVHIRLASPALSVKACYITVSRQHLTELTVKPGERRSFTFSCSSPEKHFVLKIEKSIGESASRAAV